MHPDSGRVILVCLPSTSGTLQAEEVEVGPLHHPCKVAATGYSHRRVAAKLDAAG